jgi:hypothetical protein
LAWPGDSMLTSSAMALGLPPSHRSGACVDACARRASVLRPRTAHARPFGFASHPSPRLRCRRPPLPGVACLACARSVAPGVRRDPSCAAPAGGCPPSGCPAPSRPCSADESVVLPTVADRPHPFLPWASFPFEVHPPPLAARLRDPRVARAERQSHLRFARSQCPKALTRVSTVSVRWVAAAVARGDLPGVCDVKERLDTPEGAARAASR